MKKKPTTGSYYDFTDEKNSILRCVKGNFDCLGRVRAYVGVIPLHLGTSRDVFIDIQLPYAAVYFRMRYIRQMETQKSTWKLARLSSLLGGANPFPSFRRLPVPRIHFLGYM